MKVTGDRHRSSTELGTTSLYLEFLEALGLREETVPGEPVRRELVFYQLGKFSQAISDFEQIYFTTEPKAEVRGVRGLARVPGAWLLRRVRRRRRLRHAGRGHDRDRPPGQGHAVAGGIPAVPAERTGFPPSGHGRRRPLPRHPGRRRSTTRTATGARSRMRPGCSTSRSPGRRSTSSCPSRPVADNQLYQRSGRQFFDHCAAQQWVSTRTRACRGRSTA